MFLSSHLYIRMADHYHMVSHVHGKSVEKIGRFGLPNRFCVRRKKQFRAEQFLWLLEPGELSYTTLLGTSLAFVFVPRGVFSSSRFISTLAPPGPMTLTSGCPFTGNLQPDKW